MPACVQAVEPQYASNSSFDTSCSPSIWLDSVSSSDGRTFFLKSDLKVPVTHEDGMIVLEIKSLPIVAYGSSLGEAVANFQDHFAYLWDSIALQPDSLLTRDARETKRMQLGLVSKIAIAT